MSIRSWWRGFVARNIIGDEPDGPWELYLFPGGKVGTAQSSKEVSAWFRSTRLDIRERRAINLATGVHLVNGVKVWEPS